MLITEEERETCERYGQSDEKGQVHCFECPLKIGRGKYDYRCKANSHYNPETKDWEYDKEGRE